MAELKEVKIEKIVFSKTNPRKEFNKNSLQELAESIQSNGLINPVMLRKKGSNYELVSGERRVRACKLIKKKSVVAIVKDLSDEHVLEIQYIENLQRQDVHPLDEASFISGMIETGKYNIETIADKTGKTKTYVAGRLQLTKLIPEVRKSFAEGKIELGHALLLAKLQEEDQKRLYKELLMDQEGWQYTTVAQLKNYIKKMILNLNTAPFNKKDALLLPDAGNCLTCIKRTGNNLDLFEEFSGKNICTDPACYFEKVRLHIEQRLNRAEQEGIKMVKLVTSYNGNKPENIYGLGYYKPVTKEMHKNEKALAVKGIFIEGPDIGKIIDVVLIEDLKALQENKTADKKEKEKEPSARDFTEMENRKIDQKRDIELRTALGAAMRSRLPNYPIAFHPPFLRILINQELGSSVEDNFVWDNIPDFKKLNDLQVVMVVNDGFVNALCDPDGGCDLRLIFNAAEYLGVDYKAIREKVYSDNPHVTVAEMKKRMKSGEASGDANEVEE